MQGMKKTRKVSLNKISMKEKPANKKKTSLHDELFKDSEWKEEPIFTFGLIVLFMHHVLALCTLVFLVRVTACPVGGPVTGQWMFHGGSVLGLVFAWIVDKGTNKFDFALISSTFVFVLSFVTVIVIIFDGGKGYIFCPMASVVYMFVDATIGTTCSFFLEQVKYLKFQLNTDYMLFILIWGSFFIASLLTIVYQLIILFFGPNPFYYIVSILSVICFINKIILLLLISRRVFRPAVLFNFPYMVVLFVLIKVKTGFKKLIFQEGSSERLAIPLDVVLICERFWKVAGIILFVIPFGISNLIVTNAWENAWNLSEEMFVYCKNFTAYYNFSTTALFPIYFFCLYVRRNKYEWLTTELRQMGFGNIIVILSILCITVMNIRIEESKFPLPSDGYAQIRFFNMLNTSTSVTFRYVKGRVGPYGFSTFSRIRMDGSLANNAIEVNNKEYGLNLKTSVVGVNGKSVCYYIGHLGLVYLGIEPLESSSEVKSTTVYLISDIENIQIKLQHHQSSKVFKTSGSSSKLKYTYVDHGNYNISVTYENNSIASGSETFDQASFYALLVTDSLSGLVLQVFTIVSPRFAPVEGMVLVAALLGLGNSIVQFSAVRFLLNECSPMLYTTLIAISYVCQHFVSFIHSFLNISQIIGGQSITLYLAFTASLIFLILYIYAAMSYKYLSDTTSEVEQSPPQMSPPIDFSEDGSKDTLHYYR